MTIAEQNEAARHRAFGGMKKKEHKSEWYEHKHVAKYLKDNYPATRFYTTLDGFDLGGQNQFYSALQWFESGVPDIFIFHRTKKYIFLVLELKKSGTTVFKRDGSLRKSEHLERQAGWIEHFTNMGAKAQFCIGLDEAKRVIDNYIKHGT